MTPLETLQKYGLKTDVKSIKERMYGTPHFDGVVSGNLEIALKSKSLGEILRECKSADLALLCSLAEKGERYAKAVISVRARLAKTYSIVCETDLQKAIASAVDAALEDVITEAEGE